MKRSIFYALQSTAGVLALAVLLFGFSAFFRGHTPPAAQTDTAPAVTVVLDAGHGGEDGGAIGANGVLEKQLNLQITERLGALLEEAGVAVTYTRREDKLLYTEEQNIKGKRKLYDLRNRLDIAERTENALLISIHMNTYGDKSQNGLQVYYGRADAGSRRIAEAIHAAARRDLMPSNRRQPKAAGSSIFLLDRATCPAVLIECGFLSNPEECEKLCEEDYQKALSFSLFCAIMKYISTQEKGEL